MSHKKKHPHNQSILTIQQWVTVEIEDVEDSAEGDAAEAVTVAVEDDEEVVAVEAVTMIAVNGYP